ncbi:MAG TPA: prephenate dehydrogenase/arogenate dehydrogenase family protein [Leucothrix mucor]|nr:prephenate dehydrogenase/arogenate dehydrogenase family protein [Leucothrix mucor]
MIKQLTIFGVGLIGGSLALALKKAGYCETIVGCSRNTDHLQRAVDLGVIDRFTLDPKEAVKGADMILLAVPLRAIKPVLETIVDHVEDNAIITDAGSAKGSVVKAVKDAFDGKNTDNFVPAHPIAGREKSSVEAAIVDLYHDQKVVLTPLETTNTDAIKRVKEMWKTAGAIVEILDVKQHDDVLAATSHLPHVLAYSLVNTLSKSQYGDAVFDYAAGGFKSFSRIASSDPVMWRDICLENKDAILAALNDYQQDLADLSEMISAEEGDGLEKLFAHSKETRDKNV